MNKWNVDTIAYYQKLADTLPVDVPNREALYQSYMKYIEQLKKELEEE